MSRSNAERRTASSRPFVPEDAPFCPSPSAPKIRRPVARQIAIGLLCLLLFAAPGAADGTPEIEDIPFPAAIEAGETSLPLFGLGLLRYRVVFRGYVGGLYLPSGSTKESLEDDVPRGLELHYFWDIEGRFFGEAADDVLARTQSPAQMDALRERLDQLNRLYQDVKAGDRYRLTYIPGVGTQLALNGKKLGTIPGADFAKAYFGIWLGTDPLSRSFRDQLLAGR